MNEQTAVTETKLWKKTRHAGLLLRTETGRYYARVRRGGKQVWKSMDTKLFSVAEVRFRDFKGESQEHRKASIAVASGKMTFADALAVHQQRIADDVRAGRAKKSTAHYWGQIFAALLKSRPNNANRDIRHFTLPICKEWVDGLKGRKSAKGARTVKGSVAAKSAKDVSPTRYNNSVAGLRSVFEIAVKSGAIYANPAKELERVKVKGKELTLPKTSEFSKLVQKIRTGGAWCSKDCADFVEGLAFTGARLREGSGIEWRDVDFEKGEVVIRGDAETGTKNGRIHRVPMIAPARALFERLRAARQDDPPSAKVFRVGEAQKAIDSACKKLGIPRITHHDFRHLFATVCIESGVDIPTVSRWLNHSDGGALAMKTYRHLRNDHSQEQAAKVSFTGKTQASGA